MKRKIILISIAILAIICCFTTLVACNKKEEDSKSDNISRQTQSYWAGESEKFAVSVEKGRREKQFVADGIATDVIDFCEICIHPLKSNDYDTIAFLLQDDSHTLSGEVDSGKYGEFQSSIALDFTPNKVIVSVDGVEDEIFLSDVLQDALTASDVINIARKEFQLKIDEEYAQGKPDREIYLKLITADRTDYYYYVSFIGDGVDYWAVLVDIKTGNIISKK